MFPNLIDRIGHQKRGKNNNKQTNKNQEKINK